MKKVRFKCKKCGGPKFVGDEYYAFGTYYVDITCVICSHSKDIEVSKLNKLIEQLAGEKKRSGDDNKKARSK
jgi:hypothetical protein